MWLHHPASSGKTSGTMFVKSDSMKLVSMYKFKSKPKSCIRCKSNESVTVLVFSFDRDTNLMGLETGQA